MIHRRNLLASLAGCVLARVAEAAEAPDSAASAWSGGKQARMRLVDAGWLRPEIERLAGIEIELDPGALTYWRTPGEAGVPPTVSFAASDNLARADLLFPAPGRYDEGGAEAFGYKDRVIFPLRVVPHAADAPVGLNLSLSFAVCEKLCLPMQGAARLVLSGTVDEPPHAEVRSFLARVPEPRPLGAPGPIAIEKVALSADRRSVEVVTRTGAATPVTLFPEAPDPWFLQADGGTPAGPQLTRFTLAILSRPEAGPQKLSLRLTLTAGAQAVETSTDLDAAPNKT